MNLIGHTPENDVLSAPAPKATKSYAPIGHKWIIEKLEEELDKRNIKIQDRNYIANNSRDQVTGQFLLHDSSGNEIIGPSTTFGNSYDKSQPFTISSGALVLVCSNGMMGYRDIARFSRKHTGSALKDAEQMIQQAVENLNPTFERFQKQVEHLQQVEITKRMAGEYLGRLYFEEKIITPTQLNEAKRAYFTDDNFSCNNDGNTSGFNFYNNVTEALKSTHPSQYIKRHAQFNDFAEKELMSINA